MTIGWLSPAPLGKPSDTHPAIVARSWRVPGGINPEPPLPLPDHDPAPAHQHRWRDRGAQRG